MERIDLQRSGDLKSKFFVFYIVNFYNNHVLPLGRFDNLITHTQQVVGIFGTTYSCEWLFSEMKYTKLECVCMCACI